MNCTPGAGWVSIKGEPINLSNGQDFVHSIDLAAGFPNFPAGSTSWITIDDMAGQWDGVLGLDGRSFDWREEQTETTSVLVKNRATYRIWLKMPNVDTGTDDDYLWYIGQVRRTD